jgi:hypothetical protein
MHSWGAGVTRLWRAPLRDRADTTEPGGQSAAMAKAAQFVRILRAGGPGFIGRSAFWGLGGFFGAWFLLVLLAVALPWLL